MARVKQTFRQRDLTAAIKAVERAGIKRPYRVTIGQDGSICVDLTPPANNDKAPETEPNPWEQVPDYANSG